MNLSLPTQLHWLALALAALTLSFFMADLRADGEALQLRPVTEEDFPHTYRLHDGMTAYVVNPTGEDFELSLDVRDLNLFEAGPSELLLKVYDPEGRVLIREVIEDDGITGRHYLPRFAGWDHEMWYYGLSWTGGSEPMLRWSAHACPVRLGSVPARTFDRSIRGEVPGVYRVMVVGNRDHYITFRMDPGLAYGVNAHPYWLHGQGGQFRESYLYLPRGTTGMQLGIVEYDEPRQRRMTITGPDDEVLFDGLASGGFQRGDIEFEDPERYEGKILRVEVAEGEGNFMLHLMLRNRNMKEAWNRNLGGGVAGVLAPDRATAEAIRGGAIYHDGQVFWHGFQVRLHDWLAGLDEEDFVVRDADGNIIEPRRSRGIGYGRGGWGQNFEDLPKREGFVPLAGPHTTPPISDMIMHHYPAHQNPQALNLAIRDLADGLFQIGTGDHVSFRGWGGNLAFLSSTFRWHFWRPGWRIIQETDAPPELQEILREGFLIAGDRLAFARGQERVLGNAFVQIPSSLRYSVAATGDPLQEELFRVYLNRFLNEGWGEGTGVSRSGTVQEHFAHAYHYGTYVIDKTEPVIADFGDPEFVELRDMVIEFYRYVWGPEVVPNMWSSRTAQPALGRDFPGWKGRGGPDFTVSVNDGDEWFAARREGYYILTFHGRLAPMWLNNYWASRQGYGGGGIVQLAVPGRGPVLVSTLNGSYGQRMQPSNWRNFRIHSVVGEMADGLPLVGADGEHPDARLTGNVVESTGEVRDCPVRVHRRYAYEDDGVTVEVSLGDTVYREMLWGMGRRSNIREAHEMIPFVPWRLGADQDMPDPEDRTLILAVTDNGEEVAIGEDAVETGRITIDRGGFGVVVELDRRRVVRRGANHTVLIEMAAETDQPTPAADLALSYRLIPFGK